MHTYTGVDQTSIDLPKANTGTAPGRYNREGIDLIELSQMFTDESAAGKWFERVMWPGGPVCPRCAGRNVYEGTNRAVPYRCRPCKRFFCVRTGTALEDSRPPLLKWVGATYIEFWSLGGASSTKLHRGLGVT